MDPFAPTEEDLLGVQLPTGERVGSAVVWLSPNSQRSQPDRLPQVLFDAEAIARLL
jgi:hypothetical protein